MARNESEVWRSIGRLTPTEKRIKEAYPSGADVDLRSGSASLDDPANAANWHRDRTVRAEVLAALLLGGVRPEPGRIAALRVSGVRIAGSLVLAHGKVQSPWLLRDSYFDGPLDLEGCETGPVDLRNSCLHSVTATDARIKGLFVLERATVRGDDGVGVRAAGVVVNGNLQCRELRVTGPVDVGNAIIDGEASFAQAELDNRDGDFALNASGIRVRQHLSCRSITSRGRLRLYAAEIGGDLVLTRATVEDRSREAVVLMGTRVGRDTYFTGSKLQGAGRFAMLAQRMKVGGSFYLDEGFTTDGEIRMTGVDIGGYLDIAGIDCPRALLALGAARISVGIRDADGNWPGRLNLDGLTYNHFAHYAPAKVRLAMLRRQVTNDSTRVGGYRAQPYEQLAAYYRGLGQDGQARNVLLAKTRAARRVQPWYRRAGGYILDGLVGYGYRPTRAIGWSLAALVSGSVYFAHVKPQRVSTEDTSVYNPVIYTADRLIPVIHVGQGDVWQFHGVAAAVSSVLTILGWTLGIAIAAGATRTLSRN